MAVSKRRKTENDDSTVSLDVERMRRDLEIADAERADAVRALHDLEQGRDAVVAAEDEATLAAHDNALAAVRRRVEVATAKADRLSAGVAEAEASAEQARRQALYDRGVEAMGKARRILVEEYPEAARAVAEILTRATDLTNHAYAANKALPEGVEPIDTRIEPTFNGRHYADQPSLTVEETYYVNKATGLPAGPCDAPLLHANAGRWETCTRMVERPVPSLAAVSHKSIANYVNLPGLNGEYIFHALCWGQPRTV